MAKKLKPGDRVQWNTPQGKTTGKIKKKLTAPQRIQGYVAKASKQNPKYLVQSDKSRKQAVHKPAGLRKTGSRRK